jgi:hypothetical protein
MHRIRPYQRPQTAGKGCRNAQQNEKGRPEDRPLHRTLTRQTDRQTYFSSM